MDIRVIFQLSNKVWQKWHNLQIHQTLVPPIFVVYGIEMSDTISR